MLLIRAKVAKGNRPTPPHAINKYALQFIDQEQTIHYDSIVSRRITEPKYIEFVMLKSLAMWESINEFLEVAGWVDHMNMTKPVYEKLCREFLSSLKVN